DIANGHLPERKKLKSTTQAFVEELGPQIVIGLYRASAQAPVEKGRTRAFSLQFSQLSPYLVMGMLDLNDAQQQRYQKAYDIAKRILWAMRIFPTNEEEKRQVFELDEMESGYPKMTMDDIYDVVRACGELAAGEKELDDFAAADYRFFSPNFRQHR